MPADAEIVSYRDGVPISLYAIAGVAPVVLAVFLWALVRRHQPFGVGIFACAGGIGSAGLLTWLHLGLTGIFPEVPYIWCDRIGVTVEGKSRIAWRQIDAILPIMEPSRVAPGGEKVGAIRLHYLGLRGPGSLIIRSLRACSYIGTIYEDLRERALAAGVILRE